MSTLELTSPAPGLLGLLETFPQTGAPLNLLAHTLLRSDLSGVSLTAWQREYVAAEVSSANGTLYCAQIHKAAALALSPYRTEADLTDAVLQNQKLLILLRFALKVYNTPKQITRALIQSCTDAGSSQEEIHLVGLIAAAYRMYNAYVDAFGNDGLRTVEAYVMLGEKIAVTGYPQPQLV